MKQTVCFWFGFVQLQRIHSSNS